MTERQSSKDGAEIPESIAEQFKHDLLYCTACEMPLSVSIDKDGPQPLRWECSCSVGYPTAVLPEDWIVPGDP